MRLDRDALSNSRSAAEGLTLEATAPDAQVLVNLLRTRRMRWPAGGPGSERERR